MKFLHLADLHFGKSLYGTSLIESGDQAAWTERFLALAAELQPNAVVIAGDVYDRSAPAAEAVELMSRLLTGLTELNVTVLLIAGNHDSAQRLAFARELLAQQKLHISPALTAPGKLARVTLEDEHGPVDFWLMPYVFPALAAQALGAEAFRSYDEAVRALLAAQEIDFSRRTVLVAHQNVTANGVESPRGGSETMVGGVGQVDYTAFDGFEYAALGHIHAGYPVGRPEVRYAGSPLCYHFDETKQPPKGPILVELDEKGTPPRIRTLTIPPLHPLRSLRGSLAEVRAAAASEDCAGAYVQILLTDCRVTPEISDDLRAVCENRNSLLMDLHSEYQSFGGVPEGLSTRDVREKSLSELFSEFYTERSGTGPDEAEQALLRYADALTQHADPHRPPEQRDLDRLLNFALEQEADA